MALEKVGGHGISVEEWSRVRRHIFIEIEGRNHRVGVLVLVLRRW